MTIQITKSDVEKALALGGAFRAKALSARETGEYVVGTVAQQVESGFSAFAYGMVVGAYGDVKVGPVSADLVSACALHVAGFFGMFGKYAGHAHNFAQGLADGYLSRFGAGLGASLRAQGKLPAFKVGGTDSRLYESKGGIQRAAIGARPQRLTESEIAAMAQVVR